MVLGKLQSATCTRNRSCLRARTRFPLRAPKMGPATRAAVLFQALCSAIPRPTRVEKRVKRSWIADATWKLVDERTSMRRVPTHDRASAQRLDRQVATAFKADRKARTAEAGADVEASLGEGKAKEAWGRLQAWYKHAGDRPQKPSRQDLRTVTEEYQALFTKDHPPPGQAIPVLAGPFHVLDEIPNEEEIATAVRRLRAGKAPGPSGMRTDHLKRWLAMAKREEQPDRTTWVKLVTLVQHVYVTGDLPTALPWATMVLPPKGSGG